MRIALLAHPRHPIRAPFMGGMEAHAWHLANGLIARGHDVTLFAAGDSDPDLPVEALRPEHYEADWPGGDWHGTDALNAHVDAIFEAAMPRIAEGCYDVVHNNTLHRFPPRHARARRQPTVTSLHVPPFAVLRRAIEDSDAPWHIKTVTSRQQMGRWWDAPPQTARVVHNGIDADQWPFGANGDGSAVWAGRITGNKGTALAVRAARHAGVPLTVFGSIEDRDYFDGQVAPHLGGTVRYAGHLPGDALAAELSRASVLLFTPMWDEPFGLAAIEAMACGLPIAAFDNGAVREVVGECGAYAPAGDVDALAQALRVAMALSRHAARGRVENVFSLDRMIDGYEACYAAALNARDAPAAPAAFTDLQLAPL